MEKIISIDASMIWDIFLQLMAALGFIAAALLALITWFGKKIVDTLKGLVDKTGEHAIVIQVQGHRISTVEKRQDDFQRDQERQDEHLDALYLVRYKNQKSK